MLIWSQWIFHDDLSHIIKFLCNSGVNNQLLIMEIPDCLKLAFYVRWERRNLRWTLYVFLLLNGSCSLIYPPFSFYIPTILILKFHLKSQTNSNQNKILGNVQVHSREDYGVWVRTFFQCWPCPTVEIDYLPGLILRAKYSSHYYLCLSRVKYLLMSSKNLIPPKDIRGKVQISCGRGNPELSFQQLHLSIPCSPLCSQFCQSYLKPLPQFPWCMAISVRTS